MKKLILKIMSEKVEGLLRHVLTFLGGYLVTSGVIDESILMEVVGAITTIVGFAWSFISKDKEVSE
jgi:hypothetical protein